MLKNSVKIGQLMEEIINLLEENDEFRWSLILKKLLFEYSNNENMAETVRNILKLYQGGMSSFNDLVLQKNGKMLMSENEKFAKLNRSLYDTCVDCLVGTNENFFYDLRF